MLKKFGIFFARTAIVLIVASMVFSTLVIDFTELIKLTIGDIYEYSSESSKADVISELTGGCSIIERGGKFISPVEICSQLGAIEEACEEYKELKSTGMYLDNEEELADLCQKIESGELDDACSNIRNSEVGAASTTLESLCNAYKIGNVNEKGFFVELITSSLGNQNLEVPNIRILEHYNRIVDFLSSNKVLYFLLLGALLAVLYFLINDWKEYLINLSDLIFSIGILILAPYIITMAYKTLVGFDTTPILDSFFGAGNGMEPKAVASVVFLLLLRTYSGFIIMAGIVSVIIGVAGKIWKVHIKRSRKING